MKHDLLVPHQMRSICRLQNRHVLFIIISDEKDTVNAGFLCAFLQFFIFPQHGTAAPGGAAVLCCGFLYVENHSLGEWFKESLVAML